MYQYTLSLRDSAEWNRALPASRSVFGSHAYLSIVADHHQCEPCLFGIEDLSSSIVYPFILRSTKTLEFESNTEGFDSATPEFTGPIVTGNVATILRSAFRQVLHDEFNKRGVISEFAHLNPWADLDGILDAGIVYDRDIVWVDVSLPHEVLWRDHFSHACRKNLNRSQRENVRVFEGSKEEHIREFHRIYLHTMDRNQANSSYYFGLDYFLAIFERLKSNARFVLAEYRDQIVAATLYLHDSTNVYSYLGGADIAFQEVRPTNAVVLDTINWARASGKVRLVLGGGYQPGDGIFRFKSSFSPYRVPFFTYRHIHLPEAYCTLEKLWAERYACPNLGYFPSYRYRP